jgi:hypothetical protein
MATSIAKKNARGAWAVKPGAGRTRRARRKKEANPVLDLVDDLRAIGMSVPIEEWKKLPPDFNENLDHYLYGSPRKKPIRG